MNRVSGRPVNTLYIGLHPETPLWIAGERIRVVGVADISEYFCRYPLMPGDAAFRLAYYLHQHNISILKDVAYHIWKFARPLSTDSIRRFSPLLECVVRQRGSVINVSDEVAASAFISDHNVELIVVNSWSILPTTLIALPRLGVVNIHPSRLPQYRGALPTLWALKNADRNSAVTIHLLNERVDGGRVLAQYDFDIDPEDTALSVEQTIDGVLIKYLRSTLDAYVRGLLTPRSQIGNVSTTGKYQEYREVLFLEETARDIVNKCQLYPHIEPGVYCFARSKVGSIVIKSAVLDRTRHLRPGAYVVSLGRLLVGTKQGVVSMRLFRDIEWHASIKLFALHRRGSSFTA